MPIEQAEWWKKNLAYWEQKACAKVLCWSITVNSGNCKYIVMYLYSLLLENQQKLHLIGLMNSNFDYNPFEQVI